MCCLGVLWWPKQFFRRDFLWKGSHSQSLDLPYKAAVLRSVFSQKAWSRSLCLYLSPHQSIYLPYSSKTQEPSHSNPKSNKEKCLENISSPAVYSLNIAVFSGSVLSLFLDGLSLTSHSENRLTSSAIPHLPLSPAPLPTPHRKKYNLESDMFCLSVITRGRWVSAKECNPYYSAALHYSLLCPQYRGMVFKGKADRIYNCALPKTYYNHSYTCKRFRCCISAKNIRNEGVIAQVTYIQVTFRYVCSTVITSTYLYSVSSTFLFIYYTCTMHLLAAFVYITPVQCIFCLLCK